MKASLISRDWIADSVELVARGADRLEDVLHVIACLDARRT